MPGQKSNNVKSKEERRQALVHAVRAVGNGMSIKKAAQEFKVPRMTLSDKVHGKSSLDAKPGPTSVFSPAEEQILEDWIITCGKRGFPITEQQVLVSAGKLMKELKTKDPESKNSFIDDAPRRKWLRLFLRRHPKISLRTAQNLTISRARVSQGQVRNWFREIDAYFVKNDYKIIFQDPSRIFNADEAAFFFNPKGDKVLYERGSKSVYGIVNVDEKECLTVLFNVSAAGDIAPPMVIFQYLRVPKAIAESVPGDWGLGLSESGWMTGEGFYEYITNVFHPWLTEKNIKRPVIFFVDGHVSHQTLHLSMFCRENKIILVTLTPNATHLLQPLDVSVFRTLKGVWKKQVSDFRVQNEQPLLRRTDFCPVLKKTIDACLSPSIIQNGFRKCGLVPFNPEAVDYSKLRLDEDLNDERQTLTTEQAQTNSEPRPIPAPAVAEEAATNGVKSFQISLKTINQFLGADKLEFFLSCKNLANWPDLVDLDDHQLFTMWRYFFDETARETGTNLSNPEIPLTSWETSPLLEEITLEYPSLDLTLETVTLPESARFTVIAEGSSSSDSFIPVTESAVADSALADSPADVSCVDNIVSCLDCSSASSSTALNQTNETNLNISSLPESPNLDVAGPSCSSAANTSITTGKTNTPKESLAKQKTPARSSEKKKTPNPVIESPVADSAVADFPADVSCVDNIVSFLGCSSASSSTVLNQTNETLNISSLPESPNLDVAGPSCSSAANTSITKGKKNTPKESPVKQKTPARSSEKKKTPKKSPLKRTTPKRSPGKKNVPSPFKRALFWPGAVKSKKNINRKEKVPAVASSNEWIAYHEKKEKLKQELEDEKQRRKEARVEKQEQKRKIAEEKQRNKRQKVDQHDELSEFEDADDPPSPSLSGINSLIECKKGDYVITEYEEEFFPGQVMEVNEETVTVKSMATAGIGIWKWPTRDDVCKYEFGDIKAVIKPPIQCNKRGHFKVIEMKEFSSW